MFKKLFIGAAILAMSFGFLAAALNARAAIIDPNNPAYQKGDYTLSTSSPDSILVVVIGISRWILGIVGALALIMLIYGGLTFMLSGGSSTTVATGQKIIIAAVVGLIIVFASYLIIKFVLSTMGLNWSGQAGPLTPARSSASPIGLITGRA